MSPTALTTQRGAFRRPGIWLRSFALFALLFATPLTQQLATQVLSAVAHEDGDCGDACEEGDCCPAPCTACHCCAHSRALVSAPLAIQSVSTPGELPCLHPEELHSSGYVSPPFRPPAV